MNPYHVNSLYCSSSNCKYCTNCYWCNHTFTRTVKLYKHVQSTVSVTIKDTRGYLDVHEYKDRAKSLPWMLYIFEHSYTRIFMSDIETIPKVDAELLLLHNNNLDLSLYISSDNIHNDILDAFVLLLISPSFNCLVLIVTMYCGKALAFKIHITVTTLQLFLENK